MSLLNEKIMEQPRPMLDYRTYNEALTVLRSVARKYIGNRSFIFGENLEVFKGTEEHLRDMVFAEVLLNEERQIKLGLSYSKKGSTLLGEKRIFGTFALTIGPDYLFNRDGQEELLKIENFSIIDARRENNGYVSCVAIVDDQPVALVKTPSPCNTWTGNFPRGTFIQQVNDPRILGQMGEYTLAKQEYFGDHEQPVAPKNLTKY